MNVLDFVDPRLFHPPLFSLHSLLHPPFTPYINPPSAPTSQPFPPTPPVMQKRTRTSSDSQYFEANSEQEKCQTN